MAIAKRPSKITLPPQNKGWNNLLEFLVEQFPLIEESIWIARFLENIRTLYPAVWANEHLFAGELLRQLFRHLLVAPTTSEVAF